jgi:hypothetical protein
MTVSRRAVLAGLAAALVTRRAAAGPTITVHRDPT